MTSPTLPYDALARSAAAACAASVAFVAFVNGDRLWLAAGSGLADLAPRPRAGSFFDLVLAADGALQVADAAADPRLAADPFVALGLRSCAGVALTLATGERVGALCVMDRTPRALDERQLRALRDLAGLGECALRQRERLQQLTDAIDCLPCGVSVVDHELRLVAWNRKFQQLLDFPDVLFEQPQLRFEDFIRFNAQRGEYGRGDPEDHVRRILAQARDPAHRHMQRERPGGIVLDVRGAPLPGGGFVTTYADVSAAKAAEKALRDSALHAGGSEQDSAARRAAEAQLEQARQAAEAANRAKSDFLDNVSHEIRTPLNGVLGLTRLLLAEDLSPQQRKYVELADASAASLLDLVNDLLDLGRIESGEVELQDAPFRLDELLAHLGELYRLRAQEKGLRFELEVAPQVPATVSGDAGRLRQVLNHLLANAAKFTAEGEFGLIVGRAGAGRGPDVLHFTVCDTGIGIPLEAQPRLFTRFAQADRATARTYGGTGLGLAIVKQLCEQMGGTIWLQSEPGRGSSFRCELPLRAVRDEVPARQAAVAPRAGASHAVRVLVAEDNPTNQVVVRGLLAQAGYHDVTLVDDGLQAVSAAMRGDFDVVLMDCRMPVLDGYAATRRLRADGYRKPVIALTANASTGERERCLAHGMSDYVAKPVDPARLAQVLAQWVHGAAPPDAGPAPAPPSTPAASFERAHALERLGGDEDLLAVALASYREHAPRVVQAAREALAAADAATLRRHLHSLAGSSAMVGAEPLRELAQSLEARAQEGDLEPMPGGLERVAVLVDAFLAQSARW